MFDAPSGGYSAAIGVDTLLLNLDGSSSSPLKRYNKDEPLSSMVYQPANRVVTSRPATFSPSTITAAGGPSCREPIVPQFLDSDPIKIKRPITMDSPIAVFSTNVTEQSANRTMLGVDPSIFFKNTPATPTAASSRYHSNDTNISSSGNNDFTAAMTISNTNTSLPFSFNSPQRVANNARKEALLNRLAGSGGGDGTWCRGGGAEMGGKSSPTTTAVRVGTGATVQRRPFFDSLFSSSSPRNGEGANDNTAAGDGEGKTPKRRGPYDEEEEDADDFYNRHSRAKKTATLFSSRIIHDPHFNENRFEAPHPSNLSHLNGRRFLSDLYSTTAMEKESAAAASATSEMLRALSVSEARSKARAAKRAGNDADERIGGVAAATSSSSSPNFLAGSPSRGGGVGVRTNANNNSINSASSGMATPPRHNLQNANLKQHHALTITTPDAGGSIGGETSSPLAFVPSPPPPPSSAAMPFGSSSAASLSSSASASGASHHNRHRLITKRPAPPTPSDPHTNLKLLPMILDYLTPDELSCVAVFVCKAWYKAVCGSIRLQVRRKLFEPLCFYEHVSYFIDGGGDGNVQSNNNAASVTPRGVDEGIIAQTMAQQRKASAVASALQQQQKGFDGRGILFYLGNGFRGDPHPAIKAIAVSSNGAPLYTYKQSKPSVVVDAERAVQAAVRAQQSAVMAMVAMATPNRLSLSSPAPSPPPPSSLVYYSSPLSPSSKTKVSDASVSASVSSPRTRWVSQIRTELGGGQARGGGGEKEGPSGTTQQQPHLLLAQLYRNPAEGLDPTVVVMCSRLLKPILSSTSLSASASASPVRSRFNPLTANLIHHSGNSLISNRIRSGSRGGGGGGTSSPSSLRLGQNTNKSTTTSSISPSTTLTKTTTTTTTTTLTGSDQSSSPSSELAQRGKLTNFTSFGPSYCITEEMPYSWIGVDLGPHFRVAPTAYTLGTISIEAQAWFERQSGMGEMVSSSSSPPPKSATTTAATPLTSFQDGSSSSTSNFVPRVGGARKSFATASSTTAGVAPALTSVTAINTSTTTTPTTNGNNGAASASATNNAAPATEALSSQAPSSQAPPLINYSTTTTTTTINTLSLPAPPFPVAWELQGCRERGDIPEDSDAYDPREWADRCRWHVLDRRDYSQAVRSGIRAGKNAPSLSTVDGVPTSSGDSCDPQMVAASSSASPFSPASFLATDDVYPFSNPDRLSAIFTISPEVARRWGYFKRFRIVQTDRNNTWGHALCVSGFELYGSLVKDTRERK